jgi:hypothetical protein
MGLLCGSKAGLLVGSPSLRRVHGLMRIGSQPPSKLLEPTRLLRYKHNHWIHSGTEPIDFVK